MSIIHPQPTGKAIKIGSGDMLVSKTDPQGNISYGNKKFIEISGYEKSEIIGSAHSILRHPDMPKAIFYMMWQSIKNGRNIMAVIKNLSKNGDHYWVTTDFDIQRNKEGIIRNYIAFRHAASKDILKVIEPLYAKMLEIENEHGMDASINYLETFLKERNQSYNQFIEELAKPKGIAGTLLSKMKKLFE